MHVTTDKTFFFVLLDAGLLIKVAHGSPDFLSTFLNLFPNPSSSPYKRTCVLRRKSLFLISDAKIGQENQTSKHFYVFFAPLSNITYNIPPNEVKYYTATNL